MSGGDILGLALPGGQHARLEGSAEAERQSPRSLDRRDPIESVQVESGLLFALASAEEGDARDGRRHATAQRGHGGQGDLLGGGTPGALEARRAHVRLEEGALQVDVVVAEGLVHGGEDLLGDALACGQVVVAVGQDLGLYNWHNAVLEKKELNYFYYYSLTL